MSQTCQNKDIVCSITEVSRATPERQFGSVTPIIPPNLSSSSSMRVDGI
jgi:hypothetical protein